MKADPVNIDLSLLLIQMHRQKLDRRDHKSLKYIYEKVEHSITAAWFLLKNGLLKASTQTSTYQQEIPDFSELWHHVFP